MVAGFENDFAAYCDAAHCVGVNSGTDALRFALIAAGVASGDIVVTVPNTFIATTEAISQAGARPVFVDIDEATYNQGRLSDDGGVMLRGSEKPLAGLRDIELRVAKCAHACGKFGLDEACALSIQS